MKTIAAAIAAFALAAAGSAAAATVNIWSTNFDGGNTFQTTGPFTFSTLSLTFGGAAFVGSEAFPGFGTDYLRNDTDGTTTFAANGLGAHSDLHLAFDLAFIDSWDGDGTVPNCCSPDFLFVNIDGGPSLALSDNGGNGAAPTTFGPGVVISHGSNLGQNGTWNDSVVHYDFVLPHTASTFLLAINFGGAGFQGGFDESWGIDNFSLSATTAGIPEPASWAVMIFGFGLAGAALRRRRALPA